MCVFVEKLPGEAVIVFPVITPYTSGNNELKSSRSPMALIRPASRSASQLLIPQATRSHTSGSNSMVSGGVRLWGSELGPSSILTAAHGATRTSTAPPGALIDSRYKE